MSQCCDKHSGDPNNRYEHMDDDRENDLHLLEDKICRLKLDIDDKREGIHNLRRELAKLVMRLQSSELELKMSVRELSISRYDYARVKRRNSDRDR